VRGFTEDEGVIDYPLKKENGILQEALTQFKTLDRTELEIPFGKHLTSRYSLIEIRPQTGRYHQIRKHLDHIHHPIIGDRPHGCNKQNKLFKEKFQLMTMMLHASALSFTHPVTKEHIFITAELQDEFKRMIELMNFS
jgi:tRNA pseudouridine65 synthase